MQKKEKKWVSSTSTHDLNPQQTRNRKELPQPNKEHLNKTPATNIIINEETLTTFAQKTCLEASDGLITPTEHDTARLSQRNSEKQVGSREALHVK